VSRDGSRIFFMSPDPDSSGVSACSGTGSSTSCPAQLYVRQENEDGSVSTRWISRAAVADQDASLIAPVLFEGASADGDRVFFRTTSPLTADDPNGTGAPAPVGGIVSGAPSPTSSDLYMYDLPDGPDNDPAITDADPAGGTLTRLTAGPGGGDDPNAAAGALRFISDDGHRILVATSAPLTGLSDPADGTITAPGGAVSQAQTKNLYSLDLDASGSQRYRFVAQLPSQGTFGRCATTALAGGLPLASTSPPFEVQISLFPPNCVRGNSAGTFFTFFTEGRLLADDPDAVSGDIYAYDASTDQLTRVTAPQGGTGSAYRCDAKVTGPLCYGDQGISGGSTLPSLGIASDPSVASDRLVFFQSKSRLTPTDQDDQYDVYQWRNGKLTMISPGLSPGAEAFYVGNDGSGRDVYLATSDRLTWQDVDAVPDVYTARVDGGIPEPVMPPVCSVLADACQGAAAAAPAASAASSTALRGEGNVIEKHSKRPKCGKGKVRKHKKCVKKHAKRRAGANRRAHR
jgi:hypothetical protein